MNLRKEKNIMFAIRFALLLSFLYGYHVIAFEGPGICPHGGPHMCADQGPTVDPNGHPHANASDVTPDAGPRIDPEG
jgi:hypothetical protein